MSAIVGLKKIRGARQVCLIPQISEADPRPVKGAWLIPNIYANCILIGEKERGKTTVIFNILKACLGKKTTVIFFVSTINNDIKGWLPIKKWLDDHGIAHLDYSSINDESGNDPVKQFVTEMTKI